ncbi:MAG TPA: TetR family transcriptional regulator [Myxococcota bacterium]|nr:TetR family transcriptional regulator [Myxococcota bacterium]
MAAVAQRSRAEEVGTRDRIVAAALEVFAQKGFAAASTREIASRVGVNHGLIPYYFRTKERLWQAAVDLAFADLAAELEAVLAVGAGEGERARAGRLVRGYVRFVARRPAFVHLMHDEGRRRGPRLRWIVDRHVRPLFERISELLEAVRASGTIGVETAPVHFFYALVGAAGLIFHQAEECRRLTGVDPFDAEVVEAHARLVEALLLGPEPG